MTVNQNPVHYHGAEQTEVFDIVIEQPNQYEGLGNRLLSERYVEYKKLSEVKAGDQIVMVRDFLTEVYRARDNGFGEPQLIQNRRTSYQVIDVWDIKQTTGGNPYLPHSKPLGEYWEPELCSRESFGQTDKRYKTVWIDTRIDGRRVIYRVMAWSHCEDVDVPQEKEGPVIVPGVVINTI